MSLSIRTITVCTVGMLTLSACATRGALRRGLEEERNARVSADSAQRYDIASLRTDVTALRADLNGLRTEFGAKIAEVSEGLRFAIGEALPTCPVSARGKSKQAVSIVRSLRFSKP